MHELEKIRKQLEGEKLELQSALEEAEVRAWLHLHSCLGPSPVPSDPTVSNYQVFLTTTLRLSY